MRIVVDVLIQNSPLLLRRVGLTTGLGFYENDFIPAVGYVDEFVIAETAVVDKQEVRRVNDVREVATRLPVEVQRQRRLHEAGVFQAVGHLTEDAVAGSEIGTHRIVDHRVTSLNIVVSSPLRVVLRRAQVEDAVGIVVRVRHLRSEAVGEHLAQGGGKVPGVAFAGVAGQHNVGIGRIDDVIAELSQRTAEERSVVSADQVAVRGLQVEVLVADVIDVLGVKT